MEIDPGVLRSHARRYDYTNGDGPLLGDSDPCFPHAGDGIRARGFARRGEVHAIARWKSPRRANLVKENPDDVVEAVTGVAFALMGSAPKCATKLLAVLDGVSIPTASAILTVVDPQTFGIIDRRAWGAVGQWYPGQFPEKRYYQFRASEYLRYLQKIRGLAESSGLSCREVDMALWHMGGEDG